MRRPDFPIGHVEVDPDGTQHLVLKIKLNTPWPARSGTSLFLASTNRDFVKPVGDPKHNGQRIMVAFSVIRPMANDIPEKPTWDTHHGNRRK